jgi:flagellar motor protein MotB
LSGAKSLTPNLPGSTKTNRLPRRAAIAAACALLVMLCGCAGAPPVIKSQLEKLQQQQANLTEQNRLLQERAAALDRENQAHVAKLAQAQQEAKLLESQLAALRDQLRSVTAQLAQARAEKGTADKRVEALSASLRRQSGVTITPNNSFLEHMPALDLPPGYVRRDGDVIRVALPADQLFEPNSSRLRSSGVSLIVTAGNELFRLYPDQMIGIEGYTDIDPPTGGTWRNNHELSVARAMAVFEVLLARTQLQPTQLFVVGHGPNNPMVSNATAEGKQVNRRVELVVYPEKRQK